MFRKIKMTAVLLLVLCMMPVLPYAAYATGKSDNAVPITMTANKAALQSSVPTDVAAYAKVDVVFKKGAEGSTVTTRKDGASANVENKTKGQIELIGKTGSATMEPGNKGSVSDALKNDTASGSTGGQGNQDQGSPAGQDAAEGQGVTTGQDQGGPAGQALTDSEAIELLDLLQDLAKGGQLVFRSVDSVVQADAAGGESAGQDGQEWKDLPEQMKAQLLSLFQRSKEAIQGQAAGTESGAESGNTADSADGAADVSGGGNTLFSFVGDHLVFMSDTPIELTVHDSLSLVSFGEGAEGSIIILDQGVEVGTLIVDAKGITIQGAGTVGNLVLTANADNPDGTPAAGNEQESGQGNEQGNQHRHIPGDWVVVSEVPATIAQGGSVTMVQYCADPNCGQQIDINTYPTDPLPMPENKPSDPCANGHTGGTATCKSPAICTVCGQPYGPLGDHVWGDIIMVHDSPFHECQVCGLMEEVVLPDEIDVPPDELEP